jgi:hypothetical protein
MSVETLAAIVRIVLFAAAPKAAHGRIISGENRVVFRVPVVHQNGVPRPPSVAILTERRLVTIALIAYSLQE